MSDGYEVIRLVHLAEPTSAAEFAARVRAVVTGIDPDAVAEPAHPGSRNGGDVLVHVTCADAEAWTAARGPLDALLADAEVAHVDGAEFRRHSDPRRSGSRGGATPGVYRALLLRVDDGTPAAVVAKFEDETLQMPSYVDTMLTWRLNAVDVALGNRWTHVWEQTFASVDHLLGQYMLHPVHWGLIDRWFDPESHDVIIHDKVCHSFAELPVR